MAQRKSRQCLHSVGDLSVYLTHTESGFRSSSRFPFPPSSNELDCRLIHFAFTVVCNRQAVPSQVILCLELSLEGDHDMRNGVTLWLRDGESNPILPRDRIGTFALCCVWLAQARKVWLFSQSPTTDARALAHVKLAGDTTGPD